MTNPGTSATEIDLLAEALVDANDQLLALYELASISADSLDEDDAVERILLRAQKLLGAQALYVGAEPDHFVGDPESIAILRSGIPGPARSTATSTITDPTGRTITVSARRERNEFGTADTKLLDAVAVMLSGAIHTARLHKATVEQAVMASDHDTASRLAQSALPRWLPQLRGADVYARSEPARSAGGDLYCFDLIDDVLYFAVGDVSGKGLPAAMMMTNVISATNAAFRNHGPDGPRAILEAVDRWMYQSLSDAAMFVTLLIGSFDPATNELNLSNAGHSPVLMDSAEHAELVLANHPPLGVIPITDAEHSTIETNPRQRLVVASDGITEQLGITGDMYGEDRLIDLLHSNPELTAAELGATIFDRVELFAGNISQSDDRTLFIVNFGEGR